MTVEPWPLSIAPISMGERCSRRRSWRSTGAVLVSATAHILLVGLALWSAADHILHLPGARAGNDGDGAVTVSLVRVDADSAAPSQQTKNSDANDRLDHLLQKFRDTGIPVGDATSKSATSGDGKALLKELEQAAAPGKAEAGEDQDGFSLWPKVRPCWRPPSNLVVTLDIGVDSAGRLAGPPVPVRSNPRPPGRAELLAESAAVQAAVRCAPFLDAAPVTGRKSFRVTFAYDQPKPNLRTK